MGTGEVEELILDKNGEETAYRQPFPNNEFLVSFLNGMIDPTSWVNYTGVMCHRNSLLKEGTHCLCIHPSNTGSFSSSPLPQNARRYNGFQNF